MKKSTRPSSSRTNWTMACLMTAGCLLIGIGFHLEPLGKPLSLGKAEQQDSLPAPRELAGTTPKPTTAKPATPVPPTTPKTTSASPSSTPKTTTPAPSTTKSTSTAPTPTTGSTPTPAPGTTTPTPTKTTKPSPFPTPTSLPSSTSISTTSPSGTPKITHKNSNTTSTPAVSTTMKPPAIANVTTKPPTATSNTTLKPSNTSITPIPTASLPIASGTNTPIPTAPIAVGNRTNGTSTSTPRPVNGTNAAQNTTSPANSTCALSLCGGAQSCKPRRELRIAAGSSDGAQPKPIQYEICQKYGFYGQITSSNVKPSVVAKDRDGKDLAGTKVTDAPECAKKCLNEPTCQWFTVTDTDKTCELFQDVTLDAADQGKDGKSRFVGFLLAASPNDLNRQMACTQKREITVSAGQGKVTLCKTATGTSVLPDPVNGCGAGPWTLYRGYLANGRVAANSINVQEFDTAMGEPENFLSILSGQAVTIATKKFSQPGTALTTWTYRYDQHGRVVSAEGAMSKMNIVDGQTYRVSKFQDNFNTVHHLTDSTASCMPFVAGHVVANEFTNANSFWNFVPQASKSNSGSGCWRMAEKQIEKLLSMGCTGTMKAQLSYFDVADLKTINTAAKTKLQAANAEDYMTYDADTFYNPANPGQGAVSYPCNFFYRPLFMNLDFTITGADDNSACKLGLHALTNGKFFTVGTDDTVKITRVFADWSMGGDSSNLNPLMGFATNVAKKCLAETGEKIGQLQLSNAFSQAYLLHRASGKCVVCDASGKPQLEVCNSQSTDQKWTSTEDGTLDKCSAKFVYDKAITYDPDVKRSWTSVTFSNGKMQIGGTVVELDGKDQLGVVYDYTTNRQGAASDGSTKRKASDDGSGSGSQAAIPASCHGMTLRKRPKKT